MSVRIAVTAIFACIASANVLADQYPISGVWALFDPSLPKQTAESCASYQNNPKKVVGNVLVFEGIKKVEFNGGYLEEETVSNISVKKAKPNEFQITDRYYQDEEGGAKPGYRRRTYRLTILSDTKIEIREARSAASQYVLCNPTVSASNQPKQIIRSTSDRPCLKKGDRIEGTVQFLRTKHENGTVIEVYQLVSFDGYCVKDDFCPDGKAMKRFHLMSTDPAIKTNLEASLGHEITIKANDYFCPHTQWHFGDAVASGVTILGKRPNR
jgi:hypothetical protein